MVKSPLPFTNSARPETDASSSGSNLPSLEVSELKMFIEMWLMECEIRQHSDATLANRRLLTEKLLWFYEEKKFTICNKLTLTQFMLYVKNGHKEEGGRWGNTQLTKAASAGTSATYHRHLRALFNWIVKDGGLAASPMESIASPVDRPDDIQPFTELQMQALFAAARKTAHPKRDEAILMLLLDSGARISEICALRRGDLDVKARSARVEGKGGKQRSIYISPATMRAIWQYMQEDVYEDTDPLFAADRGTRAGDALTRSGMQQLIHRIAKIAGITRTHCSPHTFRHTFAVMYLKAKNGRPGGSQLSLMQILGHTNVKMTSRYVQLAQSDVAHEHRMNSPVEQIKRRKT